jgi:YkoY family integral membrane protein
MNDLIHQTSILWQDIMSHPGTSIGIIINLIIIESLLSVDNAAVLATMVMDLPEKQRGRALKLGIWGAYFFRGLAMIFAGYLIQFWYLKPLGGLYLLYLVYSWWKGKQTPTKEDDLIDKKRNWLYRSTVGAIGPFWATVALVELMDMAFSIDNIFAAVAFTPNIILVCIGVFIGILAMRFIAQWFVKLMERFNFLETAAFVVIGILGLKLSLSIFEHFYPESQFSIFMTSHAADLGISILTVSIFFIPIITSYFFNMPKKHEVGDHE